MLGERAMSKRTMREDWETPEGVIGPLRVEFRFTVDGAATAKNAKCARYWRDAFDTDWTDERVWLNPPYGYLNLAKWMAKAYRESQQNGATVVCLVPAHTGQPWWHDWVVGKASEIRWIKGKVKFVGAASCAPFPSCIVIYRPAALHSRSPEVK